jgi:hypothetical protein
MRTDRDYRMNQKAAQARWRQRHPDYWKHYRARKRAAAERKQHSNDCAAKMISLHGMVAKMDENSVQPIEMPMVKPGRYILRPLESLIAKMDGIAVELTVIS